MRKLRLALLGLLAVISSHAQIFTGVPPPPADLYYDAPIIDCWLFGAGHYESATGHNDFLLGSPAFCGQVDNPVWLAFTSRDVAGFVMEVTATSCINSEGIQLQIYEVAECDLFQMIPVGTCYDQIFPSQTTTVEVNNLPPNRLYYLFIDGYDGDICDFSLVINTITYGPPLQVSIAGPTSVLSGHTYTYQLTGLDFMNTCGNPEYIDTSICLPGDNICVGPLVPVWTAPPGSVVQVNPDGSATITIGPEPGLITVDYLCFHAELWVDVNAILDNCQNGSSPGSTSCADAAHLCGDLLDGYCGTNAGAGPINAGNLLSLGLCNMPNTHWVKFAPCDSTATFNLAVSNCLLGSGLNMVVVQSDDCENFTLVNACTVLPFNLSTTVTVNGLEPGHWYYILLAGQGGDVCDFGLSVVSGIDGSPPSAMINEISPGYIDGPSEVCVGETAIFTIVPPVYTVDVVGGGGCILPTDACSNTSTSGDSIALVWHIPDGAVFLSDSVNVLSVDVLFNDTIDGYVWVYYQVFPLDSTQVDSLDGCACTLMGSLSPIGPHHVDVIYNIIDEYIFTNCEQPCAFSCSGPVCASNATLVCQIDCGFLIQHIIYDNSPLQVNLGTFVYCQGQCHFYNGTPYCSSGNYSVFEVLPSGCQQITSFTVIIQPFQTNNLGLITLCQGECFTFGGNAYCASGTYSIPGIDPATGCPNLTNFEIQIIPQQVIDLGLMTLCEGECFTFGGNAYCAPGPYSIPGIDPATGCPNLTNFEIQIIPQQIIDLGPMTLCEGECFTFGGNAYCASGTYSVPGIDPATGCPNLTLFNLSITPVTDTDLGVIILCEGECFTFAGVPYCAEGDYNVPQPDPVSGCLANTHFIIVRPVATPVVVSAPVIICNAPQTHYTLSFTMQGTPPFYVNGVTVLNNNYLSAPIETGTDYYFEIYDSSPCNSDQTVILNGSYDCGPLCLSSAGAMLAEELTPCINETAIAGQASGNYLAPGDVSEYIMHSSPDETLGTIISRSTSGAFAFDPGQMQVDQVYYISYVVGPPAGSGQVDLGSECLSVARGRPVTFKALPQLTISGDTMLTCDFTELALTGQSDIPAATIKWQGPGNFTANQIEIQANLPGMYELEVSTNDGCTSKVQQWISQDTLAPHVEAGPDAPWPCTETDISLEAYILEPVPSDYEVQWSGGDIESGAQTLQPVISAPGWYFCHIRNLLSGCISVDSIELSLPVLILDLGEDRQIKFGESLTLDATTNVIPEIIHWSDPVTGAIFEDDLSWTVQPLESTVFQLSITDANGCEVTDEVLVEVLPHNKVYAPNAFSPNGDGINDKFTLYGFDAEIATVEQMNIYDRWGGLVFQQAGFPLNDESKGWNGSYSSHPATEGVYIYQAVVKLVNGQTFQLSGDVTLVR